MYDIKGLEGKKAELIEQRAKFLEEANQHVAYLNGQIALVDEMMKGFSEATKKKPKTEQPAKES